MYDMGKENSIPETSREAYNGIKSAGTDAQHRNKIAEALTVLGSATAAEIAAYTHLEYLQVARRLRELVNLNKAKESGEFGLSPSKRKCIKWEAVKVAA